MPWWLDLRLHAEAESRDLFETGNDQYVLMFPYNGKWITKLLNSYNQLVIVLFIQSLEIFVDTELICQLIWYNSVNPILKMQITGWHGHFVPPEGWINMYLNRILSISL